MKIRKSSNKQLDFLLDEKDSIQWRQLQGHSHQKIEQLLSHLLVSIINYNQRVNSEGSHANKN